MTEFQPTPQTPEQVDEGLRNAFRQAIKDGVMDATPYLKQMTFTNDIEKTEAEIKVLQKKLELLKEIETHKSQKLWNILKDKHGFFPEACDEIVDVVEGWLPKEHDTNSYKWNECLKLMRENLR
jgi:DNA phosphorothioation-dependent restriction protein DptG